MDPEDDAAYVNWGPEWCMPTLTQQRQLIFNCTSLQTALNGVSGLMFMGPNGNVLFLPSAGFREEDRLLKEVDRHWSRSISNSITMCANYLFFDDYLLPDCHGLHRSGGHSVRPARVNQD